VTRERSAVVAGSGSVEIVPLVDAVGGVREAA
jgi:hypothetical protein